jgi:hypothetical protein
MRTCGDGLRSLLGVFLLTGLGVAADADKTSEPPSSGDPAAWVDARVDALAPQASEKRFDEIGWSTDIEAAAALAKKHARPLFLFTHDGRMAEGRC